MADTKITNMTAASALTGAEVLPVVQSAANVKATAQQVVDAAMTTGLTRQALGSINTNTTIDWSLGSYVTATIAGALTFTFSNPAPTGKACVAYLQLTNGGSAVITWPVSVTWSGGTAPTLRTSGVDLLRFYTQDNGTTWFGTAENDESNVAGSDTQVLFNDAGSLAGDSGFTFNKTNNTIDLGGGTVTASDPVIDASQTWNNAGVTFTGLKFNVTNTASASGSLIFDYQVGGSSVCILYRTGEFRASSDIFSTSGALKSQGVDKPRGLQFTNANIYASSSASVLFTNAGDTAYAYGSFAGLRVFGPSNTSLDLVLERDAANTLAQRNGTNAQTFRVYKTYTDASNHARLTVSAGVLDSPSLQIIGESAGTDTYTNVDIGYSATKLLRQNGTSATLFGQHFVSFSDNTYDIGSSSAGWRTGYFDTSVITPTIANAGTAILAATRLRADGFATALTSKTADYTATATDATILVDASGAARTITLPAASGISGRIYVIKKTDSSGNAVTVDANASETIDGATTYALSAQYKFVVVQCDGANWHIIGAN